MNSCIKMLGKSTFVEEILLVLAVKLRRMLFIARSPNR